MNKIPLKHYSILSPVLRHVISTQQESKETAGIQEKHIT